MTMSERKIIELESGWEFMQKGITKLKNILGGIPEQQFTCEEYIMLYETVYNMCTQKPPQDYSQQLYDRYKESFEEYITSMVLPALRKKHDELLLRELVKQWGNYEIMIRRLGRFFDYLDRYFVQRQRVPPLNEVSLVCFHDLVYQEIKNNVRGAVTTLIDKEREGEQIDRALLKNVLGIFVEIGMGNMDAYENDFELAMLEDTASYYSRKAASWILEYSCPDYMLKVDECLREERDRVSHYLHSSSEQKLLEVLRALREKHNGFLLRELVEKWENYQIKIRWPGGFFSHLDPVCVRRCLLLNEVSLMCFRDLVYQEIKNNVRDAVITLIDREREGEQIDRALLKNVLGIFVEIGMGNMDAYENDFESAMLEDTASYYSRKAASWILEDSCPDYMLNAEECLKREKERVSHYLHSRSEQKLLEKVQNELLSQYESQLLEKRLLLQKVQNELLSQYESQLLEKSIQGEKEHSGCHALLRDDKVDDLSPQIFPPDSATKKSKKLH